MLRTMRISFSIGWLVVLAPALAVAACVGDSSPDNQDSGLDATTDALAQDSASDAGADATDAAACDLDAPFGAPTNVAGLSGLASVARFSSDELTAYFALAVGDAGLSQLYAATRPTLTDTFGTATPLTTVNDGLGETTPYASGDGLTLFYAHNTNGANGRDIYYAARQNVLGSFQSPQEVGIVNDPTHEDDYVSQASSGDLWFSSRRNVDAGVSQIFHAPYVGSGFGTPAEETELDSLTESNLFPLVTPDLLRIYFQRGASLTIWTATRSIPSGPFGTPQVVDELTVDGTIERPAWISADGCRLYVAQGQPVQMTVAAHPPK
jgi:hypothetical protein